MSDKTWNQNGTFPGLFEKLLDREGLISKKDGIIDKDRLLQFGIFSFLLWFLPYKREYYFDPEKNQFPGSYFNFYVTGLSDNHKIIFLLSTEKDKFVYPHRNIIIPDPLNHLINGDTKHENCSMNYLMLYNASYLKERGLIIRIPEVEEGCYSHKKKIRDEALNNNLFPAVFGGWPIPLEVNPEILEGLEVQEKYNRDCIFNEFISLYFKYKIDGNYSYSNVELELPFKSHEIDACIIKANDLVMLETSTEFSIDDQNIKRKIYNLWSIEKIFDRCASFYLTFGEIEKGSHLHTFMSNVGSDGISPHFLIINFPKFLKNIENHLKDIKSEEDLKNFHNNLLKEFEQFLDEIEEKILEFL